MAGDNLELKAQLYANMGDVYNELNNFEESDRHFEKALNINPRNAYVLNNYSYYLSLRGENLKRAQELSFLANEIEPNNSSFLDTYAWVLYKSEKYKDAKEWQMKAIEASENPSATLMEHLGDILFMLGDEKNALEKWKKALELSDSNEKLVNKIADKTLYE
jgi:Tfp pilus assembly protein PilF